MKNYLNKHGETLKRMSNEVENNEEIKKDKKQKIKEKKEKALKEEGAVQTGVLRAAWGDINLRCSAF